MPFKKQTKRTIYNEFQKIIFIAVEVEKSESDMNLYLISINSVARIVSKRSDTTPNVDHVLTHSTTTLELHPLTRNFHLYDVYYMYNTRCE